MHNFFPTSPVLGDPLQLVRFNVSSLVRLHACSLLVSCILLILLNKFNSIQPRLRDVCLKVTSPGVLVTIVGDYV